MINDPACYFYRNADGFCLLENRCWAGKPCPKNQQEADRTREALVAMYIKWRDKEPAR